MAPRVARSCLWFSFGSLFRADSLSAQNAPPAFPPTIFFIARASSLSAPRHAEHAPIGVRSRHFPASTAHQLEGLLSRRRFRSPRQTAKNLALRTW